MPLPQNLNVIIGAGVFGIVCAATLYVVEHYRQDRRRHAMAKDLARLNNEFAAIRKELDSLLAQQKQKYFYNYSVQGLEQFDKWNCRAPKKVKRGKRADSHVASSTTTEDYTSAIDGDSSDLEFYDVSDDEADVKELDSDLERIDTTLEQGSSHDLEATIERLEDLCLEFPENPQLLWRLGKAHYRLFEKTEQATHLNKGIEACNTALKLTPELANVHKWLAILLGERCNFQPMKEKILDGHLFKQHVDAAVQLNPVDPSLHHMLGRFAYDVAELKWYERKVASALFAEPPNATYEEALMHFLEAEKLSENDWKENSMYIAKCKVKLGATEEAVSILEGLVDGENTQSNGVAGDVEIQELLKKYKR